MARRDIKVGVPKVGKPIVGTLRGGGHGGRFNPGIPTGDGTMDFSIATGDDTGLLVLLEDI